MQERGERQLADIARDLRDGVHCPNDPVELIAEAWRQNYERTRDEAAMERAIKAVNVAHESKIDATWRELLTVAFRAAGETP